MAEERAATPLMPAPVDGDTAAPDASAKPVPWKGRRRVSDPRDAWVHVRCNADEHARLTAAATEAGLSLGAYVRATALGHAGLRAVRRPAGGRAELARILGLLGNYGSNLNQLARVANTNGELPAADWLEGLTANVRELRTVLMQALGRELPRHGD